MFSVATTHPDGSVTVTYDPRPIEALRAEARTMVAAARWQASQTMTYDGVAAPADGAMQALTATVVAASAGLIAPGERIVWKLADDAFRSWTIADLLAYGAAIRAHVQGCFDREAALGFAIEAAPDVQALCDLDLSTGWPGQLPPG